MPLKELHRGFTSDLPVSERGPVRLEYQSTRSLENETDDSMHERARGVQPQQIGEIPGGSTIGDFSTSGFDDWDSEDEANGADLGQGSGMEEMFGESSSVMSQLTAYSSASPLVRSPSPSSLDGPNKLMDGDTSVGFKGYVDDQTIATYASKAGKRRFPDPDIVGNPIQKALSIDSVYNCFNSKAQYNTKDVFPKWITGSSDWKSMKGLIKDRELMEAFMCHNHLRSPAQIDLIRGWLIRHWDMARHLGLRRCTALAKAVQFFEIARDEIIITEGERGYTFYIIIEGEVSIFKKGYGKISTLGKGKFFGERALTSNQYENRQATVVSASDPNCKLLVLHKSDYDTIIRNYQESIRTEAYRVLKNVSLFQHWSRSRLERVCSMLERREVPANTVIFRQGDLPDYIYIIVEGNIEVVKEITVSTKNRWPKAGGGYEEIVRKYVNKFKILDIGHGKYFGEIAIVNNTCRAATCQTTVPTVLLALDKFEFLNLLHKGHAMANVYNQTLGYPNDEDILHLFTALKVQKKQAKAIKETTSGGYSNQIGNALKNRSKINNTSSLPSNYDKRRKSNALLVSASTNQADIEEQEKKQERLKRLTRGSSVSRGIKGIRSSEIRKSKDDKRTLSEMAEEVKSHLGVPSAPPPRGLPPIGDGRRPSLSSGTAHDPGISADDREHKRRISVHRKASALMIKKRTKGKMVDQDRKWGERFIRKGTVHDSWGDNMEMLGRVSTGAAFGVAKAGGQRGVKIKVRRKASVFGV